MKAVILAGGRGTRLAPYTTTLPKPLMPIDDMPILEIVLRQLAHYGFDQITLAVGYLAELIMAYCGDGRRWGVTITYSREELPLGTAGPILLLGPLREPFLVMNGDVLTTINFRSLWDNHRARGAIATLATYQRDTKIDLGVIETDSEQWVTNYIEKPVYRYSVSSGIYIFDPEVVEYIPPNVRFELPELVLSLIKQGKRVSTFPFGGYWLDIGRHDDYQTASREFETHRHEFLPETSPTEHIS